MLPNSRQKFKTDPNDVVSSLSALSMPSLTSLKPQLPMTKSSMETRRKTPAETISETKRMLSNGVRLVSTRRPITPREPRRQLYGKISLADRPPSSFSLSYLQVENRVLPPIGTTSHAAKRGSLNGIREPQAKAADIRTFDNELTSNTATPQHYTESCSMGYNAKDLRAKSDSCNESYANTCIGEGGDNGSNIAINLNIATKTNRTNSCPKLPTLLTDSKAGTSSNYAFSGDTFSANGIQRRKSHGGGGSDNGTFNIDIQKNFAAEIVDILEYDGQITLPLTDETNQSSMKKPISEQRRLLLRSNDLLAQSSTEILLDMLKSHSGIKDCSEETILHINGILTELYGRVKGVRNDWRGSILSSLYGLVECNSPQILLSVARVVLVLDVTGSNLTGACKLVFKVARNEKNDNLFANIDVPELLIDGLGRANPIDDPEACIYGYGAVRFLANALVSSLVTSGSRNSNSSSKAPAPPLPLPVTTAKKHKPLACRLIQHGANPLMILHLQMINEAGAAAKLPTQTLHALYQLSSAFRVLSKIIMSDHGLQLILLENNNKKMEMAAAMGMPVPSPPKSSESYDSVDFSMVTSKDFEGQIALAGPHLIRAAEICINQAEVQLSIIRTLSILSEHESCCDGMVMAGMAPRLGILLGPILVNVAPIEHRKKYDPENVNSTSNKSLSLLNRIGYILGNLMAKCESARLQFYNNDVAMEYLLKCSEYYANESVMLRRETRGGLKNTDNEMSNGGGGSGDVEANDCQIDTVTDVVIKLIRVIANLSVNAEVGYKLANHHQLGTILLTLLNTINKHRLNFNSEFEELLLATLGAIHNLSFYQPNEIDDQQTNEDGSKEIKHPESMIKQMATISAALCAIYQWAPETIQSEIARVLGNLTRSLDARVAVHSAGGLQFLLKNLSSDDWDIVETSCGVLVNMLSDWERRAPFRELRGPLLLRNVLQRSALKHDWLLALITCQAMWNYIIDAGNAVSALGEDEADYISADILEYLDEEKLFGGSSPDPEWEDFAIVAADLLERIQSSLSYNNTPYASSEDDADDANDDEFANSDVLKMSKTGFKMWLANS